MHRILLAIRVFFGVLFSSDTARRMDLALEEEVQPDRGGKPPKSPPPKRPEPPTRSEALTLLATLQREARFVDFIQEPLADYSDAQIGAAARDVHDDCGKVFQRLFALKPVVAESEGAEIEVGPGFDAARYRLTGNVTGEPPYRGHLMHHGWEATQCELPTWSGSKDSSKVVAPIEVEVS